MKRFYFMSKLPKITIEYTKEKGKDKVYLVVDFIGEGTDILEMLVGALMIDQEKGGRLKEFLLEAMNIAFGTDTDKIRMIEKSNKPKKLVN